MFEIKVMAKDKFLRHIEVLNARASMGDSMLCRKHMFELSKGTTLCTCSARPSRADIRQILGDIPPVAIAYVFDTDEGRIVALEV